MEAACGKNPVYHTGKLFTAIGDVISENIYEKYKIQNVVYCTSKMGDNIEEPWNISIELNRKISKNDEEIINDMVNEVLKNHYKITEKIINKEIKLNSY
jgi:S-adenosylmethionine synthetase